MEQRLWIFHLRAIRDRQHLTQEEVAHRTGISLRRYAGYEAGHTRPNYLTFFALARALNVDVYYLGQQSTKFLPYQGEDLV